MIRIASLVSVFLISSVAACLSEEKEKETVIVASEWSKPAESHDRFLQARWLLIEGRSRAYAGPGSETMLYVELQNATSAWGAPLRVYFDPAKGLEFEVVDADGKALPPSPTFGSGGDVGKTWITLPYDSTIRLRANPGGWGLPKDAALVLPLRPHQGRYWLFRALPEREYFVKAKLTIAPPTEDTIEHRDDWRGTIEFPAVKLPVAK